MNTRLENAAILLANELERYIAAGTEVIPANLTLALNEFRKAQADADLVLGADLDGMFKQYEYSNISKENVISIAKAKIKIVK
jgi:hypothetical protein